MSISVQQRFGRYQLRVKHKLLPKAYFDTFETELEARQYGEQLHGILDRGIIPAELMTTEKRTDNPLLSKIITDYLADSNIAPSDRSTISLVSKTEGHHKLQSVTASWADAWVSRLKTVDHLAPSSIRKRVESLARAIDWHWRRKHETVPNPLRSMPRGYASPTDAEIKILKSDGVEVKRDAHRNRRLDCAEIMRIRSALSGIKHPDKQRPMPVDKAFSLMFELILATGLRLSEAYKLRVDQIDMVRWVIRVEGSKGHRGVIKPRVVPVVKDLRPLLEKWCKGRVGLMFPFWDGSPDDLPRCTARLSQRFGTLFDYAGVAGCTEHDLRHEATCQWVTLRDAAGRWVFSEIEIAKIMGWSDLRMMLLYASLRGEDLASRLG